MVTRLDRLAFTILVKYLHCKIKQACNVFWNCRCRPLFVITLELQICWSIPTKVRDCEVTDGGHRTPSGDEELNSVSGLSAYCVVGDALDPHSGLQII